MDQNKLLKTINYLIIECNRLKNKYVDETSLEIDYVCIFSQNENEYNELYKAAKSIGKIADDTITGPIFTFNKSIMSSSKMPNVLKIRKPDITRPQKGDVDFTTDYPYFKNKY